VSEENLLGADLESAFAWHSHDDSEKVLIVQQEKLLKMSALWDRPEVAYAWSK
jgi:hypothetical protein